MHLYIPNIIKSWSIPCYQWYSMYYFLYRILNKHASLIYLCRGYNNLLLQIYRCWTKIRNFLYFYVACWQSVASILFNLTFMQITSSFSSFPRRSSLWRFLVCVLFARSRTSIFGFGFYLRILCCVSIQLTLRLR